MPLPDSVPPVLPLPRVPSQIWAHLSAEQQRQAIQLMARLALNVLLFQLDSPSKNDVPPATCSQNPA